MDLRDSLSWEMEEKVDDLRKKIIEATESLDFEEVAERAGLYEKEEYSEVSKLNYECSAIIEKLLKMEKEDESGENSMRAIECQSLEKRAEELRKKGFTEATEGRFL